MVREVARPLMGVLLMRLWSLTFNRHCQLMIAFGTKFLVTRVTGIEKSSLLSFACRVAGTAQLADENTGGYKLP